MALWSVMCNECPLPGVRKKPASPKRSALALYACVCKAGWDAFIAGHTASARFFLASTFMSLSRRFTFGPPSEAKKHT